MMIGIEDIKAARSRIRDAIRHTPILEVSGVILCRAKSP